MPVTRGGPSVIMCGGIEQEMIKRSLKQKPAQPKRETDLAPPVIRWLAEDLRFDVYQEVPHGGRADIVGLRPNLTCVVELKQSLSLDVLAQAKRWLLWAHWIFVAVPSAKPSEGRYLAREVCEQLGIGLLEVHSYRPARLGDPDPDRTEAKVLQLPRYNRKLLADPLRAAVQPEHKTFAPAGSKGAHWTPWRASVARLKAHVAAHEGCLIAEAVHAIGHHWANDRSAKQCITLQIHEGIIGGLRIENGRLFLLSDGGKA